MKLTEITIYPVKSCAGISLPSVKMDRFGPEGDRRWMVVNDAGSFLTQREVSRMAQVGVTLLRGTVRGSRICSAPLPIESQHFPNIRYPCHQHQKAINPQRDPATTG